MFKITRRIGLIAGPAIMVAGIAAIPLASAGPASASTPQPGQVYGNPVTLSVTIPNSTTLTISPDTESINFGSPTVLPAILGPVNSITGGTSYTGTGAPTSTAVKGNVVSNDPNGYTVQATANDSPWGQVTTPSISAVTQDAQWASGYASAVTTTAAGYQSDNSDTGATGLPAVTCDETITGVSYSADVPRIPETWQAAPVDSSGSLYASSTTLPSSGNHGEVPTTSATAPIGNMFIAGVDNINDGNGMAEAATCTPTAASDTTLYGEGNAYVVTDTFATGGYMPWSDLSVVGDNGTFGLTSVASTGSSTVTTDACTPVAGATAGQAGYCGPDGSGSDPIADAWTLDVPGTQLPGTFYGNLGYSVLSD
jgi:hypothetical protein